MNLEQLTKDVLQGKKITFEEARWLYDENLEELSEQANRIREHFCSNVFDLCTIINAKSGHCSENCKFCAQSAHNSTKAQVYPLLPTEEILAQAKKMEEEGVLRFSLVTSGKRLSDEEVHEMCQVVRVLREETTLSICVSFGLLTVDQFRKLKEAGVTRVHNNLESSKEFFPSLCTSHSFQDKLNAIQAAQSAGLTVCSGGIMGLGETVEDRLSMAFTLRDLGINSIPINMLNPIAGTPFENHKKIGMEEMRRIVSVYRFIFPHAALRLAGGRGLLADGGRSCFLSGINAAITGDMLTTAGITVGKDQKLIDELHFKVGIHE